jgi:hypothetical protein
VSGVIHENDHQPCEEIPWLLYAIAYSIKIRVKLSIYIEFTIEMNSFPFRRTCLPGEREGGSTSRKLHIIIKLLVFILLRHDAC